jgi:hypothetical protein
MNWNRVLIFLLGLMAQEGLSANLYHIHGLKIDDIECLRVNENKFSCTIGEVEVIEVDSNDDESDDEIKIKFSFNGNESILSGNISTKKPTEIANLTYDINKTCTENIARLKKEYQFIAKTYLWKTEESLGLYNKPEIEFIKNDELHKIEFIGPYCDHDRNSNVTNLCIYYHFDDDRDNRYRYVFHTYAHSVSKKSIDDIFFLDDQKNVLNVKSAAYTTGNCPIRFFNISPNDYSVLVHDNFSTKIADGKKYDSYVNKYYKVLSDQIIIDDNMQYIWADGAQFYAVEKHKLRVREQIEQTVNKSFTGFNDSNVDKDIEILEKTNRRLDFPPGSHGQFQKGFYAWNPQIPFQNNVKQKWVEINQYSNSWVDVDLMSVSLNNGLPDIPGVAVSSDKNHVTFDITDLGDDECEIDAVKNQLKMAHWLTLKMPLIKCSFSQKTDAERSEIINQIENLSAAFSGVALQLGGCVILEDQGSDVWSARPAISFFNDPKRIVPLIPKKIRVIDGYKNLPNFIDNNTVKEINFGKWIYKKFDDLNSLIWCSKVKKIPLEKFDKNTIINGKFDDEDISEFLNKATNLESLGLYPRDIRSTLSDGISRTAFRNVLSNNALTLTSLDLRWVKNIEQGWFVKAIKTLKNLKSIDVVHTGFSNKTIVALAEVLERLQHLEEIRLDMPYWKSKGTEYISKLYFGYGEKAENDLERVSNGVVRGSLWLAFPLTMPIMYGLASSDSDDDEILLDFYIVFNSLKKIRTLKTLELRHKDIQNVKDDLETRLQKSHAKVSSQGNNDSVVFSVR